MEEAGDFGEGGFAVGAESGFVEVEEDAVEGDAAIEGNL